MRTGTSFILQSPILSDLFASGEYYNFYGQIKNTVVQSEIQKKIMHKKARTFF